MSSPYDVEIRRACDGDALDQARAFEIYDKVTAEGEEGAQMLAQAVTSRLNIYQEVPEKTRLLELLDILVANCDDLFHVQLVQQGFFQALTSDSKVQIDQPFRVTVQTHLITWLRSLSGNASEVANDALNALSPSLPEESATGPQPGGSKPPRPSDQLLNRGPREVIRFQTPKLEKQLCRFLLSSYVQAGDILRTSRRVKWFSLQGIHIARQAFHLIIRFNDFIGSDGPTDEQYDEGMELDDALEELEDKIDELEGLKLEGALQDMKDHEYDLARLYQIFFSKRDFYPNGRDYTTDPVLKRLTSSDRARLNLARRLQARSPHTGGFQIINAYDDDKDDGGNQGHISDVSASQTEPDDTETARGRSTDPTPPTEELKMPTAPIPGGNVEGLILAEPQSQATTEVAQTTTADEQQQETTAEAVTGESESHEEAAESSLAGAAGVPTRGRGDDEPDEPPEDRFKCTVPGCSRGFSEHYELKAHIHEHDDKPYECTISGCKKAFSTQFALSRHHALHMIRLKCGLEDRSGGKTTTETTSTDLHSATMGQVTPAQSSVLLSTSSPLGANQLPPGNDASIGDTLQA